MQAETLFKKKVRATLKKLPLSWWLTAQMLSILGIPDLIGCVNGKFVALELKISKEAAERKSGKTVLQARILLLIRNAGGYAEFVYPENWEKIHREVSAMAA